ncbi:MAG: glycosyltransferase [Paludibacteraceae bacterium]|nr:glycosyltransferase [Paludibacteraceae bacterium]
MKTPRRILISPLDWGLGHASRIIPLIDKYLELGDNVIIAGSGMSLNLLKKQYPHLQSIEIPSFKMKYSASKSQVWAVAKAFPSLIYYSAKEHKALKRIVNEENIDFIISDNRFGLFHKTVPSAYITHQLLIKLPKGWAWLEPLVAFVHRCIINRFTECWVPDYEDVSESLAGELSHPSKMPRNVKYIGVLSRFSKRCTSDTCLQNRITPYRTSSWRENITPNLALAILSGAEPQRTMLEEELLTSLQDDPHESVILVQGKIEAEPKVSKVGKVTVCNYMSTEELQENILKADKIICRSGYSSIMDLHALGKLQNATLIPTPGQTEQEYLAEYISNHIK